MRPDNAHTTVPSDQDDNEILRSLFDSDWNALVRVAARILRNDANAEDAVQSAFLRARERAPSLPSSALRAWLRTVVRRTAIDMVRGEACLPCVVALHLVNVASSPSESPVPWAELDVDDLDAALKDCPDAQRTAFALWTSGLSYEGISRRLGIPLATVASRIFRAKARIRAHFAGQLGEDYEPAEAPR